MGKHVIVISEDALIYEDTATLEQLPVFGSIWKRPPGWSRCGAFIRPSPTPAIPR